MRFAYLVNRTVGRFAMYLIFVMMGILLFATISRTVFDVPHVWVIEMAQFTMAAYYLLGGGYTLQLGAQRRQPITPLRVHQVRRHRSKRSARLSTRVTLIALLCGPATNPVK